MADTRSAIAIARCEARVYGHGIRYMIPLHRGWSLRDIRARATLAAHFALLAMRLEEREAEESDG